MKTPDTSTLRDVDVVLDSDHAKDTAADGLWARATGLERNRVAARFPLCGAEWLRENDGQQRCTLARGQA